MISAILNGNGASTLAVRDHRDRFAAIASQGEQKSVELFVVALDFFHDIFFSFYRSAQIHLLFSLSDIRLAFANLRDYYNIK